MSRQAARIGRNGGPKRINTGLLRVTVNNDGTMKMRSTQVVGASGICETAADAIECLNASPWGRTTIVNDDHFPVLIVLLFNGRQCFTQQSDPVEVRNDDGYKRMFGRIGCCAQ